MIIEGNEKEKAAMAEFHKGNRKEGLRLQEEFAAAFREEYKEKDHCPCKKACRYHGNCKECVAIHRAIVCSVSSDNPLSFLLINSRMQLGT